MSELTPEEQITHPSSVGHPLPGVEVRIERVEAAVKMSQNRSAEDRAGVAAAGRLSSDASGTIQAATTAVVATTNYNMETTDGQRWGDYSQTVVDPVDDMTIWTFQEYCSATNQWGTRVVQLRAPFPAAPTAASPASIAAGSVSGAASQSMGIWSGLAPRYS